MLALRHAFTQVDVADDGGAALRQRLVCAEVVGVRVRIDHELDRLAAHFGDRRLDLVAHLLDGGIDEQNAVVPDQDQGVASLPAQQIDAMAEIRRLDIQLRVIDPVALRPTNKKA